jgi:hypothetical protein
LTRRQRIIANAPPTLSTIQKANGPVCINTLTESYSATAR